MGKDWSGYWAVWFTVMFASFIVPETMALVTRHYERTLSAQVWKLEQVTSPTWTAAHFLIGGALIVLFVWLIGHFVFYLWR